MCAKLASVDLAPLAGTAAEPLIHARRWFGVPALCGKVEGMWTTQRVAVSCSTCLTEIEKRIVGRATTRTAR